MLFLKRCSDVFDQRREYVIQTEIAAGKSEADASVSAEQSIWYKRDGFFWVPPPSRYEFLLNEAHQNVGNSLNKALTGIETANTSLYDVLEHIDFTRKVGQSKIADIKLRELITHFSKHRLPNGDFEFPDLLDAAYEYLIGEFADSAGKKGGEFSTPRSVVRMMVRLLKPELKHDIYDPCCGSGGMLIAAKEYIDEQGGDVTIVGSRPRRDLFNGVRAVCVEPAAAWQPTDAPPLLASNYVTEDGGEEICRDMEFPLTTSAATVQRLMKIELERNRRQREVAMQANLSALRLRPWDGMMVALERLTPFLARVTGRALAQDAAVNLQLSEEDSAVWAWNPATDERATGQNPSVVLPNPGVIAAPAAIPVETPVAVSFGAISVSWSAVGSTYLAGYEIEFRPTLVAIWQGCAGGFGATAVAIPTAEPTAVRVRTQARSGAVSGWREARVPSAASGLAATGVAGGVRMRDQSISQQQASLNLLNDQIIDIASDAVGLGQAPELASLHPRVQVLRPGAEGGRALHRCGPLVPGGWRAGRHAPASGREGRERGTAPSGGCQAARPCRALPRPRHRVHGADLQARRGRHARKPLRRDPAGTGVWDGGNPGLRPLGGQPANRPGQPAAGAAGGCRDGAGARRHRGPAGGACRFLHTGQTWAGHKARV